VPNHGHDASRPLWATLSSLAWPWLVLLYVWWLGLRWTLIGLGALYGLAFVISTAIIIDRERRE
jgi:hypothetical protein